MSEEVTLSDQMSREIPGEDGEARYSRPSSKQLHKGPGQGMWQGSQPCIEVPEKGLKRTQDFTRHISQHRYPAGEGRAGGRVLLGDTEALSIFCLPVVIPWGRDLSWEPRPEMSPKVREGQEAALLQSCIYRFCLMSPPFRS